VLESSSGRKPVKEWLRNLRQENKRGAMAVDRLISKLAKAGREFGLPGCKFIGEGLYELRDTTKGPGYRVYFTWVGSQLVVLLVGGDKSSQERDIETARRRMLGLAGDDCETVG
jgi:putative addiction module killer protein